MRAKLIYEKFTADSDPIDDLHIGMAHQIKKWVQTIYDYNTSYKSSVNDLLWICAKYGKTDFVKYILSKGADVHVNNDRALRWASGKGHTEVVKVLLNAAADVHANNDDALRSASENGHTEVVKVLLDAGANVHANHDRALRAACANGHVDVVKVLLDAGANVHHYNDIALRAACANGHVDVVKVLLDAGANVHALNDGALRVASSNGHSEVVKVLKDWIEKEKRQKLGKFTKFFKLKESLNEKFTEDSDPIQDLGIGMRHKIIKWLEKYEIKNYTINDDLTIDVHGPVQIRSMPGNFPDYIQFNKIIAGHFYIGHCNMTSLRGCPRLISGPPDFNGNFDCNNNKLTSLIYAPKEITGSFFCDDNTKEFTEEDVKKVCKVGKIISC